MNRHLTSLKSRLTLITVAALAALLAFAAVASAATGTARVDAAGSAKRTPQRYASSEAMAVAHAKAVTSAKNKAARRATAVAKAKARGAARRKLERQVPAVLQKRANFNVKVVKTRTRTNTTTVPAKSATPASVTATSTTATPASTVVTHSATTLVTTTATVTAAATSQTAKSGATATATATATVTTPVSSGGTQTPSGAPSTTSTTAAPAPTTTQTTPSATPAGSTSTASAATPMGMSGSWNTVLDSEFNGSSLDTNIWTPGWFGTGVTDPVNPAENNCYNSNNVSEAGGYLNLSVTAQTVTCNGKTYPYTAALISSNPNGSNQGFLYTYGVVQTRMYIPAAANGQIANWPAAWSVTTPDETYGEGDAFEGLGGNACYHYHSDAGGPGNCDYTLTPGWHTFASDWEPGSITFYYDGVKVGQEPSATTQPMYVIVNNSTSSEDPNLTGASTVKVQYVRVYQHG